MANPLDNCTLHYFQIVGLAEPIRMMLTKSKTNWNNEFIPVDPAERQAIKDKLGCPSDGFPILQLQDGRNMAQSQAIYRYVGKLTGFYPSGNSPEELQEAYLIDNAIGIAGDIQSDLMPTMRLGCPYLDAEEEGRSDVKEKIKMSMRNAYTDDGDPWHGNVRMKVLPMFYKSNWQKRKDALLVLLKKSENKLNFVNDKVTLADMVIWGVVYWLGCGVLDGIDGEQCPGPELCEWRDRFAAECMDGWTATKRS